MPWSEVRREVTRACHEQFGLVVGYSAAAFPNAQPQVFSDATVRLHSRRVRGGDLERDGFAEVVETVDRVIFLLEDWPNVAEGHHILYQGQHYRLAVKDPRSDDTIAVFEVVKRPAGIFEPTGGGPGE